MGENLNDLDKDESGRSVLHKAVEKNFLSVVEKFLDYGFDPLSYDSSMEIPLHIAIRRNYDEMAALIVSKLNNFV
jgi:ankyrin repeat protein